MKTNSNIRKPLKFALVGIGNTAIDFCIYYILTLNNVSFIIANIFSTGITFVISFFLNRKFTFESEGRVAPQLLRFIAFTLIGLWVLQPLVIWCITLIPHTVEFSQVVLLLGKLFATGVSMVWNFVTYDRFVFFAEVKSSTAAGPGIRSGESES